MRRALSFAYVVALVVACKAGEGSACKKGESTCLDKGSALSCIAEKYVRAPCAGPLGCTKFETHANCDNSVSNEGDVCLSEAEEEYACTPDKKRALVCTKGRFVRYMECRGKGGCSVDGRTVACDTAISNVGDPCKAQGATACTEDGKQMVTCQNGKFVLYRHCRGQYGCYSKDDAPTCDLTKSLEGDTCGVNGLVVCSVDGQSELVCQGSTFMRSRACKKGCTVTARAGKNIQCD
jgi:hypothetical protein